MFPRAWDGEAAERPVRLRNHWRAEGIFTLCCAPTMTTARHQRVVGATAVPDYPHSTSCVRSTTRRADLEPITFRTLLTNFDISSIVTAWPPQLSACTLRLVVLPRPYHPYHCIGKSPRRAWAVGSPTGPLNQCSLRTRAFESLALRQFLLFDL